MEILPGGHEREEDLLSQLFPKQQNKKRKKTRRNSYCISVGYKLK